MLEFSVVEERGGFAARFNVNERSIVKPRYNTYVYSTIPLKVHYFMCPLEFYMLVCTHFSSYKNLIPVYNTNLDMKNVIWNVNFDVI